MTKTSKPWYKRRRYWTAAILALLVYFCLIPSPLRVSPETTGYTEPLLPNGDVDYFGVYEQTYIDKLSPPENNGQRLLIAALGPNILEQNAIAYAVPWEEFPTNERSKQWFENTWIPLCEHMYIDPYVKPRLLDNPDYYRFMQKEWEAKMKEESLPAYSNDDTGFKATEALRQKLSAAPWTAEEYPDIVRWLAERSPVLDLFGIAVRKPNFVCWRPRPEFGTLYFLTLPEVQANRHFGRELSVRVTERLGRGDVDGAWEDVMSMFYLSRKHYIHDPIFVVNLVGIAIEGNGGKSAQLVLQHGNPTPEQLERFAQDLNSLPRRAVLDFRFERYFCGYGGLRMLQNKAVIEEIFGNSNNQQPTADLVSFFLFLFGDTACNGMTMPPGYLTLLPLDRNIAGKRITEYLQMERRLFDDSAWNVSPILMKKHVEETEKIIIERGRQLKSSWNWLRVPLIRTRSQLAADYAIDRFTPALWAAQHALDNANTRLELLRLAVALKRYKSALGDYPAALDDLVPMYLDEVPLDPCTGRKTLVYQLAPDDETAFLVHSAEWTITNSRGIARPDLFLRMAK